MLFLLATSFLQDIILLLKKEPGFFDKEKAERKSIIKNRYKNYPQSFVLYLENISEKNFLNDIKLSYPLLLATTEYSDNGVLNAVADYISKEFGILLDALPDKFFFESYFKRKEILGNIFDGSSSLDENIIDFILSHTIEEITEEAIQVLQNLKQSPVISLQTPVRIEKELKQQIRAYFHDKHEYSFVEFHVNSKIIGGIKIFENGRVYDNSWLKKIQNLSLLR